MKIKDCLGISNAKLIWGQEDEILGTFSKDTRTIKPNDVYIGLKGEVFDGSDFYEEAFKKGAKTCILEHIDKTPEELKKYFDKNIILVDNSLEFLMSLAKKKRNSINVPIIAITGSVGKTSTKTLIADVLATKYKVLRSIKNENTWIGMSLRLLNYQDEDCLVLEMGMNEAGEIHELSCIARPTVAVITNIGTSHIGLLGSRENILKAKLEILDGLEGPLVINNDNDLLHTWAKKTNRQVITYGLNNNSDYQAENVTYTAQGSSYEIKGEVIAIPVIGQAFIYNSLAAITIGQMFGIPLEDIKRVLASLTLEPHRMQFILTNNYTIIDDTYNSSYDSVAASLEVLSNLKGRKIAVLGDILELGDYGEEIHRQIGKLIKEYKIDALITVGDLASYINEEVKKIKYDLSANYHFPQKEEAISFLKDYLQADDIVLVKASNAMNFLEIVNNLK